MDNRCSRLRKKKRTEAGDSTLEARGGLGGALSGRWEGGSIQSKLVFNPIPNPSLSPRYVELPEIPLPKSGVVPQEQKHFIENGLARPCNLALSRAFPLYLVHNGQRAQPGRVQHGKQRHVYGLCAGAGYATSARQQQ